MAEVRLAIFDTADEAAAAVSKLKRSGFSGEAITLMSSEPIHLEGVGHKPKSRIGLFSVAGGVIGGVAAWLLVALTSEQVNLVTGGMPIVSPWPFGIIIFEMTALGAILGTLGRMIYEARLARRWSAHYNTAVADGKIVVAVECADDTYANAAERIFAESDAKLV